MKKVILSALTIAAITISCSKSNDTPNYSTSILGKWTEVSAINWYEPKTCPVKKDTTFFASSSYALFLSNDSLYALQEYTNSKRPHSDTGTYSLSGNSLTLKENSFSYNYTIQTLTPNSLKLYFKFTDADSSTTEAWAS